MSDLVTWRDARNAFRLLDELGQLSHDTLAWRRHLVAGTSTLVGAQVGPATVHDSSKALHKRLDARSRTELLAKARALPRAPRLLLQEEDLPAPR
ncbi:hypothetical protein OWM54_33135 [Myxococcus sp. MISCRS1]|uniref:hypothetical protein n=1 Tax=Myxococcus sp. MISCRS1 TaxID=2996786 RepID=UPI00226EC052|nr:hypothetical protein [Myxococcus sp. MISCRS1]MCY1002011.1 hypothetical protein [Myxococcus sp. MISCRS1]